MAISNGSVVVASEVNSALLSTLTSAALDNRRARLGWEQCFRFTDVVAATAEYRRTATFSLPSNAFVEVLAITAANMDGTTTALLEQDAFDPKTGAIVQAAQLAFMSLSTSVDGAGVGATVKGARMRLNNARSTRVRGNLIRSNPVLRVIPKGTPMRLSVSTTNTLTTAVNGAAAAPAINVILALRSPFERL